MGKGRVCGLFSSEEELQLATITAARNVFITEMVLPALEAPAGRGRLLDLCLDHLAYVEGRAWPGGYISATVAVAAEVSARPGAIHDRVAATQREWSALLVDNARLAYEEWLLTVGEDPGQLAVELAGMLTGTDIVSLLHEDPGILERVRGAARARLASPETITARDEPAP